MRHIAMSATTDTARRSTGNITAKYWLSCLLIISWKETAFAPHMRGGVY
jgi:hypothetical protein